MLKQPNFFHSQPSTRPKEAFARFYLSTTFGLNFMIRSVAPTRSSTFYAYYVSVNSNWVHPPPGNPRENFLSEGIPATREIFVFNSLTPGQKMIVEFQGVGQNLPKLEETAP